MPAGTLNIGYAHSSREYLPHMMYQPGSDARQYGVPVPPAVAAAQVGDAPGYFGGELRALSGVLREPGHYEGLADVAQDRVAGPGHHVEAVTHRRVRIGLWVNLSLPMNFPRPLSMIGVSGSGTAIEDSREEPAGFAHLITASPEFLLVALRHAHRPSPPAGTARSSHALR